MSTSIVFDANTARALEKMYQTPDVLGQRARFHQWLALAQGEKVLDVGFGPGLLVREMAESVGPTGSVCGIDQSEGMLEASRQRCEGLEQVVLQQADATQLPFNDETFDAVVSTQVYEYVPDMGAALQEAARVLKSGGRILILDTDWDSLVWSTHDPGRMKRVVSVWDEHLHDPHLPTTLGKRLRESGLRVYLCEVIPIVNTTFHPNCYSHGISYAIRNFVSDRGGVSSEEANAWHAEFTELQAEDAYFFSLNRYVFGATKP